MKREHILLPPDFDTVTGKLRVVDDSIQQLMDATERMADTDEDEVDAIVDLLADITSSLVVLHVVVEGMLKDEAGTEP